MQTKNTKLDGISVATLDITVHLRNIRSFLVAQKVKNLLAMRKTWAGSLRQEDPLEKGMATHSSILAWRISMDRGDWQATVHWVAKGWTQLSD